jgi:hypothetical protein
MFALKGGPVFGGKGNVVGTYAGVLVPSLTVGLTDNSLVLFTLNIPQTGLASGTLAVFRNGLFYSGTIRGSADPDTAKLFGAINASFTRSQREVTAAETQTDPDTGTVTTIFITSSVPHSYDANGQFVGAKIVGSRNSLTISGTRIRGNASMTYRTDAHDPNCTPNSFSDPPVVCPVDSAGSGSILYDIIGFKQSST